MTENDLTRILTRNAELASALAAAIRVAQEAADDWKRDRGGKLLRALSGYTPGYPT